MLVQFTYYQFRMAEWGIINLLLLLKKFNFLHVRIQLGKNSKDIFGTFPIMKSQIYTAIVSGLMQVNYILSGRLKAPRSVATLN